MNIPRQCDLNVSDDSVHCIHKIDNLFATFQVVINKKNVNLLRDAVSGINVGPCAHPCTGGPCLNDGECEPQLDQYVCYCPIGYTNTNCEDSKMFVML